MFDRSSRAPDPTPDTPPVAFERGSGRHRADTVQMQAVPAAQPGRDVPPAASAPASPDVPDAG